MKISNLKVLNVAAITASFLSITSVLTNSPVLALTLKETFVGTTALASSSITLNVLNVLGYIPDNTYFDLSSSFTNSGFNSTLTGIVGNAPFNLTESASLTGDLGEDLILSIQSEGNLGIKDISKSAGARLIWDPIDQEYSGYEYNELGHINPFWGAVLRAVSLLIGGTAILYTPESPDPLPLPPPPPPFPPILPPPTTFKIINGVAINLQTKNPLKPGECGVFIPDPVSSSGCILRTVASPFLIDTRLVTAVVPEPSSSLSILALGTLGAAATLKRKLKLSKSTEKETTKVS